MNEKLVYIGKVVDVESIPGADFICAATVVCGKGGNWRGVVRKGQIEVDSKCMVYLPDALIPECEEMKFMEKTKWRVKMQRFRGAPSEVIIMPYSGPHETGFDLTSWTGVTKYLKEVPANMAGEAIRELPGFLKKTDELHWQSCPEEVEKLRGQPFYVTEKVDGCSSTAYRWKGNFGVCSRNWELKETGHNGYWKIANAWGLKHSLPEGYALQWETCGPKIQSNPMGLKEVQGFVFSVFDIEKKSYLEMHDFLLFCADLDVDVVPILLEGDKFDHVERLTELAKGKYVNGHQREGIVVRSKNRMQGQIVSFKAINLEYEQ